MTLTKKTHALTLRIDETLDDMLADASYEQGVSKSKWIRQALLHRLESETTALGNHVRAVNIAVGHEI